MVTLKGGDKLAAYLDKIAAAALKAASVDVGFMNGATEADGTLVAAVAAFQEFGTGTIPPRPFLRNTIAERSDAWAQNLGVALKRTNFNAATALGQVGLGMRSDIQKSIRQLKDPPLAQSTIDRKGFDKPLIDTNTMLKSVTLKVNTGD